LTAPHKADLSDWQFLESWSVDGEALAPCVLELRSRIEALEEAENDRRFRDCKAAIDNSSATLTGSNHPAKPDSSPAPEMVATDADLRRLWHNTADDLGFGQAIRAIYNLGREHGAANATCPHIVTSNEGTSYCDLAEKTANSKPTPNPRQIRSSSTDGLMQSVSAAICPIDGRGGTPINWEPEARAAILAVAEWFDAIGYGATASILRQELKRHG